MALMKVARRATAFCRVFKRNTRQRGTELVDHGGNPIVWTCGNSDRGETRHVSWSSRLRLRAGSSRLRLRAVSWSSRLRLRAVGAGYLHCLVLNLERLKAEIYE